MSSVGEGPCNAVLRKLESQHQILPYISPPYINFIAHYGPSYLGLLPGECTAWRAQSDRATPPLRLLITFFGQSELFIACSVYLSEAR